MSNCDLREGNKGKHILQASSSSPTWNRLQGYPGLSHCPMAKPLHIAWNIINMFWHKPAHCSQERPCPRVWHQEVLESFQAISIPGGIFGCQKGRRWRSLSSWEWWWLLPQQPSCCCFGGKWLSYLSFPTPLWNPLWLPCMDGGVVSIRLQRENT